MIQAELRGKIPAQIQNYEDILTSNVFTFFKYSDRNYLKDYLTCLGLEVSSEEAEYAGFDFWPKYEDGTEPDLVLICGKYYILFEAKLFSGFSLRVIDEKTNQVEEQLERESRMGEREAHILNKEFILIAITSEYYKKDKKYEKIEALQPKFIWTNWQFITHFLLMHLEKLNYPDLLHLHDLYSLLVHKRLRSFISISKLLPRMQIMNNGNIFYNCETSLFKGEYSGFSSIQVNIIPISNTVFFDKPALQ